MGRREQILIQSSELLKKYNIETIYCKGDVRIEEDCLSAINKTVEKLGGIDILINVIFF